MKTNSLLMILALLFSCRQKSSIPILNQEKAQSVYIALLEDGEKNRGILLDSLRHPHADSIFQAFNTTEQEFKSVIGKYRSDPKAWQRFFEAVAKKLEEKQNQKTG